MIRFDTIKNFPNKNKLSFITNLLKSTFSSSNENHQLIQSEIDKKASDPEFSLYLFYLSQSTSEPNLQLISLLTLRKTIPYTLTDNNIQQFIFTNLLTTLFSHNYPNNLVFATANILTTFLRSYYQTQTDSTLLKNVLKEILKHKEADAAWKFLQLLSEDLSTELGELIDDTLIQTLFSNLVKHPLQTLPILNKLITSEYHKQYLTSILTLIQKQLFSDDILKGLSLLLDKDRSLLLLHSEFILNYILKIPSSLESIELLSKLTRFTETIPFVQTQYQSIITLLLNTLQYTVDDLYLLGTNTEHTQGDSTQDIKTQFHKKNNSEDTDIEDEYQYTWNKRKAAAELLDRFSVEYPSQTNMTKEWEKVESCIMAFGTIVYGCGEVLKQDYAEQTSTFIQNLLSLLQKSSTSSDEDYFYLVKQIACWCLGRCSKLVDNKLPLLETLLTHLFDDNKQVQKSALGSINDYCAFLIANQPQNVLDIVSSKLLEAFDLYTKKNLINNLGILIELSSTFLEYSYSAPILEKLLHTLYTTRNEDIVVTTLDSLNYIFSNKLPSNTYIPNLVSFLLPMAQNLTSTLLAGNLDSAMEPLICVLDLFSTLMEHKLTQPNPELCSIVLSLLHSKYLSIETLSDPNTEWFFTVIDIRSVLHGLIGDIYSSGGDLNRIQVLGDVAKWFILGSLSYDTSSAVVNGIWAVGQLFCTSEKSPVLDAAADGVFGILIPHLQENRVDDGYSGWEDQSFVTNLVLTLGKIWFYKPEVGHVNALARVYEGMGMWMDEAQEKADGLKGIIKLAQVFGKEMCMEQKGMGQLIELLGKCVKHQDMELVVSSIKEILNCLEKVVGRQSLVNSFPELYRKDMQVFLG
eukprot:snap_masked-scaffold_93-processed-gene-0.21-mRNA-1 protein AED:1.00 eAED:1.00 QI:0/0/0/0/1/1/2/0/859